MSLMSQPSIHLADIGDVSTSMFLQLKGLAWPLTAKVNVIGVGILVPLVSEDFFFLSFFGTAYLIAVTAWERRSKLI